MDKQQQQRIHQRMGKVPVHQSWNMGEIAADPKGNLSAVTACSLQSERYD
jgi:hypothetical protein